MKIHCPKCGGRIYCLRAFVKGEKNYDVDLNGDELCWVEHSDGWENTDEAVDFECPRCNELLFNDEELALKFLKWGDLYPWKGVDDYGQKG